MKDKRKKEKTTESEKGNNCKEKMNSKFKCQLIPYVLCCLLSPLLVFYVYNIYKINNTTKHINIINDKKIEQNDISKKEKECLINKSSILKLSNLSSFYSSLFTFIGIVFVVLGLVSWRNLSEHKNKIDKEIKKQTKIISEKVKKFEKLEGNNSDFIEKVEFLHKERDYAIWIEEKIQEAGNNYTAEIIYTAEEKKEKEEIIGGLIGRKIDKSWLEIFLAKELTQLKHYNNAYRLYKNVEKNLIFYESPVNEKNKDLFEKAYKIWPVLYHLIGQVYSDYYFHNKDEKNLREIGTKASKKTGKKASNIKKELLEKAIEYYKKSLLRSNKNDKIDETQGNLAVVLIELSINTDNDKHANEAIEYLEKIIKSKKQTFNTYLDLARAKCIINCKIKEVNQMLDEAVDELKTNEMIIKFVKYIRTDEIFENYGKREDTKKEIMEMKKNIIDRAEGKLC